ncbi:MAG: bifunctional aldolase/short-chain dehydrogenase [Candidatus Nitrohelix vancouverensis]|uniref:Bifunctional aldolase/short-chain dehydrogenase n=1 Tax=Candidatus Nitrohelix vancouverensis TaxID=2705534 RepID=A0A7T0G2X5_9BACT|nr:MAG: bifunctional aldolase/short-chain dehydrogenase [Candidatus Nitrohelix vancouverensis]
MQNEWKDADAKAAIQHYKDVCEDVALRVYTSRLIGKNPALVLHGGGNTSVKSKAVNKAGEEVNTLFVKGSGWDLDTLEPAGLPGVTLDYLLKLRKLDGLSDEDMVNEQRTHLLDASSPNPSVETLLHAFLPHKFIDHSHADASLVIANQPDAEALCKKIYGDTIALVPYIMPGFLLAKAAAEVYEKHPKVKGLLLINHGLFTFGDSAKESYDRHIEAVTLAEEYIATHTPKPLTPVETDSSDDAVLQAVAPILRGLYKKHSGQSWVLHYRHDPKAREFATSKECAVWSQIGTVTPDHVIRTKQKPLLLNPKNIDDAEALRKELADAIEQYMDNYHQYFERNKQAKGVDKKELDRLPRVLLIAGLGLVTIGKTAKETRIAADVYQHTIDVIHKAFSIGDYVPLKDDDLFDMEYWSLEQAKLGKAKPAPLQGRVVYVTGAASGIGYATAQLFAQQGANLFITDLNEDKLKDAAQRIKNETKGTVLFQALDVTNAEAVRASFKEVVHQFGGLDILISNAGNAVQGPIGEVDAETLRGSFELNFFAHQTAASEATRLFLMQKTGGVLLFNASKAAFNPGKNFGPYALPKAAVMALMKQYALDYGSDGIRSNAVNADRVRTGIFSEDVIKQRAAARNLTPDDYFKNNLLNEEVYDSDVAQGFLNLALAEKTTGSVLTIDGGNIAASPR